MMETKGWHKIFEKASEAGDLRGLEKAAVDHPMDADALEGLESFGITGAELEALENQFDSGLQSGGGATGLEGFNTLLLMLAAGFAASLAFAWFYENDAVENYAQAHPSPIVLESEPTPAVQKASPSIPSSAVDLEHEGPVLVAHSSTPIDEPVVLESAREVWHLQPMTPKESGKVYVAPRKQRLWREAPDYRYDYMHNYKIYDYGKRNVPMDKEWMIGLEPGYSHWKFAGEDITVGDHYVPYLNVLEKAILAFDKEDYEKSLQHLQTILRAVSKDQNGLFYSAMCHYQMGEYGKSEDFLRLLLEEDSDVFRPEATWYLALNLLAQNKSGEARDFLKGIQARNGFYSNRAEEQLSDLE
ncbi:hypothetical protein KFE98_20305 [bacterium SCSIO 12741]|nr:hypothetical protein KFE98_20305 [bacterium SCSIO 12741]